MNKGGEAVALGIWPRFCGIWDVEVCIFSSVSATSKEAASLRMKEEMEVSSDFSDLVVFSPRACSGKG